MLRKARNCPIGKHSPTLAGICHKLPPVFNPSHELLASMCGDKSLQTAQHMGKVVYMWYSCWGQILFHGSIASFGVPTPPMAGDSPQPVPPSPSCTMVSIPSSAIKGYTSFCPSLCHLPCSVFSIGSWNPQMASHRLLAGCIC